MTRFHGVIAAIAAIARGTEAASSKHAQVRCISATTDSVSVSFDCAADQESVGTSTDHGCYASVISAADDRHAGSMHSASSAHRSSHAASGSMDNMATFSGLSIDSAYTVSVFSTALDEGDMPTDYLVDASTCTTTTDSRHRGTSDKLIIETETTVAEEDITYTLLYELPRAVGQDCILRFTDSFLGTATSGVDYTDVQHTTIITAGSVSGYSTITFASDSFFEYPYETVIITISPDASCEIDTEPFFFTLILDDTFDIPNSFVITGATGALAEKKEEVTVSFKLSGSSAWDCEIIVTNDRQGTATKGVDYDAFEQTILIKSGFTAGAFTISVNNDVTYELPDEIFWVTLTPTGYCSVPTTPVDYMITIYDYTDATSTAIWAVEPSTTFSEADGEFQLDFNINRVLSGHCDIGITNGGGTATVGADYAAYNQVVRITAGTTQGNIKIAVVNDGIAEPNETIVVTLTPAGNCEINSDDPIEFVLTVIDSGAEEVHDLDCKSSTSSSITLTAKCGDNDATNPAGLASNGCFVKVFAANATPAASIAIESMSSIDADIVTAGASKTITISSLGSGAHVFALYHVFSSSTGALTAVHAGATTTCTVTVPEVDDVESVSIVTSTGSAVVDGSTQMSVGSGTKVLTNVEQTASATFTLKNIDPLNSPIVSSVSVDDPLFAVSTSAGLPFTLASGKTLKVTVTFAGSDTEGSFDTIVKVLSNGFPAEYTFAVGIDVADISRATTTVLPASPVVAVGSSTGGSVLMVATIVNDGTKAIQLTSATTLTGSAMFSVVTEPAASIGVGSSTKLIVKYAPTSVGSHAATAVIGSSLDTGDLSIAFDGSAVVVRTASVTVNGQSSSFVDAGLVPFGEDGTHDFVFKVTPTGGVAVTIVSAVVISGPATIGSTVAGTVINSGASHSFSVSLDLTDGGISNAAVVVTLNTETNSVRTFTLRTATPSTASVDGLDIRVGGIALGTSAFVLPTVIIGEDSQELSVVVTNNQASVMTITSISLAERAAAGLSVNVTSGDFLMSAGSSVAFSVLYAPTQQNVETTSIVNINVADVETPVSILIVTDAIEPPGSAVDATFTGDDDEDLQLVVRDDSSPLTTSRNTVKVSIAASDIVRADGESGSGSVNVRMVASANSTMGTVDPNLVVTIGGNTYAKAGASFDIKLDPGNVLSNSIEAKVNYDCDVDTETLVLMLFDTEATPAAWVESDSKCNVTTAAVVQPSTCEVTFTICHLTQFAVASRRAARNHYVDTIPMDDDNSTDGLSDGATAGVIIGVLVAVGIFAAVGFAVWRKRSNATVESNKSTKAKAAKTNVYPDNATSDLEGGSSSAPSTTATRSSMSSS